MDPRVEKVIILMREEFRRETPLSEMAQVVNLSPSRLRYLFKCEVGVPPAQYLRSFRMQRAKELLETTFLSVKQIRISIGINDHSHFVREFKKAYGMTPAKYRTRLATLEPPKNLEGLLIMLVDVDQVTREQVTMMLERAGACVTTMDSANKALAALERMHPHVVIVDTGLPGHDSYALIRQARTIFDERGEQIPAIALVSDAGIDLRDFQVRLQKPPTPNQLIEAVATLMGRVETAT